LGSDGAGHPRPEEERKNRNSLPRVPPLRKGGGNQVSEKGGKTYKEGDPKGKRGIARALGRGDF